MDPLLFVDPVGLALFVASRFGRFQPSHSLPLNALPPFFDAPTRRWFGRIVEGMDGPRTPFHDVMIEVGGGYVTLVSNGLYEPLATAAADFVDLCQTDGEHPGLGDNPDIELQFPGEPRLLLALTSEPPPVQKTKVRVIVRKAPTAPDPGPIDPALRRFDTRKSAELLVDAVRGERVLWAHSNELQRRIATAPFPAYLGPQTVWHARLRGHFEHSWPGLLVHEGPLLRWVPDRGGGMGWVYPTERLRMRGYDRREQIDDDDGDTVVHACDLYLALPDGRDLGYVVREDQPVGGHGTFGHARTNETRAAFRMGQFLHQHGVLTRSPWAGSASETGAVRWTAAPPPKIFAH